MRCAHQPANMYGDWFKCPRTSLPGGFFCAQHSTIEVPQGTLRPAPRVVHEGFLPEGAGPFVLQLTLGALIFIVAFWLFVSAIAEKRDAAKLPASATLQCPPPSEYETRLVYVNASAAGVLTVTCGPLVGGRGAYRNR